MKNFIIKSKALFIGGLILIATENIVLGAVLIVTDFYIITKQI